MYKADIYLQQMDRFTHCTPVKVAEEDMYFMREQKVFPMITGALCANSHPGSYTGQDAFNNMFPVIERNEPCITGRAKESPNLYRGGGQQAT
jgi:hypothetical protein